MPSFNRARFAPTCAPACPARDDARPDLWDLVDRVRAGDAEAFGDLFDATLDGVYPYVLRRVLGDQDAAEEITADVYLAAWRGISTVRRVASSPVAWLRTIAARRVIDHHRARQRRNTIPGGAPADLAAYRPTSTVAGAGLTDRPAEAVCIDRDQARALWEHVRKLSADQHKVLRCRFEYGLTIEETAAALGKAPTAVKTLQYRAMRNLRELLTGSALDPRRAPVAVPA